MHSDFGEHVIYQMLNAPLRKYPFPHIFVEEIFPKEFYQELLLKLPPKNDYKPIDALGLVPPGTYRERHVFPFAPDFLNKLPEDRKDFWITFAEWIQGDRFRKTVLNLFPIGDRFSNARQEPRFESIVELLRDTTNYSIGPHTDHPVILISLLFYLPKDESRADIGTSIVIPNNPAFSDPQGKHHKFEDFKLAHTMPYKPNAFLGFLRTDNSWHGVYPLKEERVERNLLSYQIWVTNFREL